MTKSLRMILLLIFQNSASIDNLNSLYKLLEDVPQVPVNEEIQLDVTAAIDFLSRANDMLSSGDWKNAYLSAVKSMEHAKRAFRSPTLLPALYFPELHKFAVYLPFLVPAALPTVSAILLSAKAYLKTRRGNVEKEKIL